MRGRRSCRSSGLVFSIARNILLRRHTYARLSRATSEDQGDWSAFAVNDVVAGAAPAAQATELALLDWRGHGDGSCIEQVGDGSDVLHFDVVVNLLDGREW